jgi:hypothetical protein
MHGKSNGIGAAKIQTFENIQKLFNIREALIGGHEIKLIQALYTTGLQAAADLSENYTNYLSLQVTVLLLFPCQTTVFLFMSH